ncbi:ABC transporter ATP-binding protein [Patulibacter medicamentivorans]|uniref:ABC transporter ATP-binding protein n=1 Tax=Patulibacter medicamentivorans TaxID=1097667 RepID=UPI0014792144|nr:ABC transporter ATP-binding protein [Patulibacter medicamentivorans]
MTRTSRRAEGDAQPPVRAEGLTRSFRAPRGREPVVAVDDVSLAARAGAITAITGPSGSGKSTLLQLLAALDRPDRGRAWIGGVEVTRLGDRRLAALRRRRIGFVFQSFNLVPSLSARDNITLPVELDGYEAPAERLEQVAEQLGIADRLDHLPAQLSGGQQQRVAVARAVIAEPDVVFADEPTGALDDDASQALLRLFRSLADEHGHTLVVVTHDPRVAGWADDVLRMDRGRLVAHGGSSSEAPTMQLPSVAT